MRNDKVLPCHLILPYCPIKKPPPAAFWFLNIFFLPFPKKINAIEHSLKVSVG
jgi:hypothetical protein